MINKDTIFKRNEEMISADLDGMTVMMSIDNGKYYGFDEIATVIWDSIDKPLKVEELVDKLTREFDVSKEACEKDVLEFLEELYEKKLVLIQ